MSAEQDSVRRLAEIRERADKATSGPWSLCDLDGITAIERKGEPDIIGWPGFDDSSRTRLKHVLNASFIAHSREDVPYLLDLIDSLTAERDRMAAAGCPRCGHALRNEQDHALGSPCPTCGCMSTGGSDGAEAWRIRAEAAEAERDNALAQRDDWKRLCQQNIETAQGALKQLAAAEADRERLREALDGIKRTSYGTFTGMPESILIGHITSVHTQAEAALATPPSEGQALSAPPTPSQDAEGDGLTEAWVDLNAYCDHSGRERCEHKLAVESAIREPYEALVKAAQLVKVARTFDLGWRGEGAPPRWLEVPASDWGEFLSALTHIEESLGGRS